MFERLLRALFPPRCTFCRAFLSAEVRDGVCGDCMARIRFAQRLPLHPKGSFFDVCVSALHYEGMVREAIHRFKFRGKQHYAKVFGRLLAYAVAHQLTEEFDLVTFVPSNQAKTRKRGYHHAELLARDVAERLRKPVAPTLHKTRATKSMFGLQPSQRRANVLGAFDVSAPAGKLAGRRILLVDDIYTTGATLSECARVLKMAGAACVFGATLARTEQNQKVSVENAT
ncbi:MAG: hypothetical protein ABT01_06865 [Clostridium sp. SCN 57-10]|nr:MAG: hypothetical protein ABT01_06865 [Clostridium sp. SCN 57-10]